MVTGMQMVASMQYAKYAKVSDEVDEEHAHELSDILEAWVQYNCTARA